MTEQLAYRQYVHAKLDEPCRKSVPRLCSVKPSSFALDVAGMNFCVAVLLLRSPNAFSPRSSRIASARLVRGMIRASLSFVFPISVTPCTASIFSLRSCNSSSRRSPLLRRNSTYFLKSWCILRWWLFRAPRNILMNDVEQSLQLIIR